VLLVLLEILRRGVGLGVIILRRRLVDSVFGFLLLDEGINFRIIFDWITKITLHY